MNDFKKKLKIYSIGIDIGGTNMKGILFDNENVLADYILATPNDSLDHLLVMVSALIEPLLEKAQKDKIKIKGIGLAVAGALDYKEKKILVSPNLAILNEIKLGSKVKEIFNMPVEMDNDANCFVRAEALSGAGEKYKNIYGITLGTGIGTAWWNNKVYLGSHGGAGEIGHMIIDFNNGIQLEKAYQKLTQNNPGNLAEEAYRGDVLAEKTFEEIGKCLGMAFANIVNILDPEIFVIGGGVVESSDLFFSKMKKTMRKYIISSESRKVKIAKTKLGNYAAAIGAALLIK